MLKARGLQGRLSEYRILGKWEKTMGPVIARHAHPLSVRGPKLYLAVDSPAWMQQLSLLKPEIIEKVNAGLGRETIREIVLNLGEVRATAASPPEPEVRRELTNEERMRIEETVAGLSDPDVRQALRRLMEKDFLRKPPTA